MILCYGVLLNVLFPVLSVTVGSTMPAKTLSLTERLRFEFGVDASDETDAQQDERDDG